MITEIDDQQLRIFFQNGPENSKLFIGKGESEISMLVPNNLYEPMKEVFQNYINWLKEQ